MRRIKKWMLAAILICGTTMVLSSCSSKDNSSSTEPKNAGAPDYSQKSCWHQIPEITKEFDTFFIYPTEYIGSNEGDPDYASLGIHKPVHAILSTGQCNGSEKGLRQDWRHSRRT